MVDCIEWTIHIFLLINSTSYKTLVWSLYLHFLHFTGIADLYILEVFSWMPNSSQFRFSLSKIKFLFFLPKFSLSPVFFILGIGFLFTWLSWQNPRCYPRLLFFSHTPQTFPLAPPLKHNLYDFLPLALLSSGCKPPPFLPCSRLLIGLPAAPPNIYPVCSSHSWVSLLKHKSDSVQNLQWFSSTFRLKFKVLEWLYGPALFDPLLPLLPHLSLFLSLTILQPHCSTYWSLNMFKGPLYVLA